MTKHDFVAKTQRSSPCSSNVAAAQLRGCLSVRDDRSSLLGVIEAAVLQQRSVAPRFLLEKVREGDSSLEHTD